VFVSRFFGELLVELLFKYTGATKTEGPYTPEYPQSFHIKYTDMHEFRNKQFWITDQNQLLRLWQKPCRP